MFGKKKIYNIAVSPKVHINLKEMSFSWTVGPDADTIPQEILVAEQERGNIIRVFVTYRSTDVTVIDIPRTVAEKAWGNKGGT